MKFSLKYLLKFIEDLPYEPTRTITQLTNLGLEIEHVNNDSNNCILEVAVPPNRADLLSIIGIARELAAVNKLKLKLPDLKDDTTDLILGNYEDKSQIKCNIQVIAQEACPKYLARIIKNINNTKSIPNWMQQALNHAGINIISPIVDIVNYVMLEVGQPMHVFDVSKVDTKAITVRKALAKEQITLLDQNKINLTEQDLIIADSKEVLAIAGIMGGLNSSVNSNTSDILLECAYFDPVSIRMSVRNHNLITDASQRFARGIDSNLQHIAMLRVSELLKEIVGGEFFPIVATVNKQFLPTTRSIVLNRIKIKLVLGTCFSDQTITSILTSLKMDLTKKANIGWEVIIPSWRPDLKIEEDLIEEIARFVGIHKIIPQKLSLPLNFKSQLSNNLTFSQELKYKYCLINRGYFEAINYSFIDPLFAKLFDPNQNFYKLKNPISNNMSVMRSNLWPGLVTSLMYNQNRQHSRIRLFELGNVFCYNSLTNNFEQKKKLGGIIFGNLLQENWQHLDQKIDFFNLKSDIEAILNCSSKCTNIVFNPTTAISALHTKQAAEIYVNNNIVGIAGAMHPNLIEQLSITGPIFLFELNLELLINNSQSSIPKFEEISKFPFIRRDFSIIIDASISTDNIKQTIISSCGLLLKNIVFFDVYFGEKLPQDKKSVAFGVILQDLTKTLEADYISIVENKLIQALEKIGAILRKA